VAQRISGELELEALLSEIVTAVRDAFDYHNVMLELVDEEAKCMDVQSVAGAYADFFPERHMDIGEGMTGYAAATGETQVSGDVIQDPHYVPDAEETKSELAVPIMSGKKVIGVLDIQSDEFDAFDETEVMLMETLADQVAVAIENARLYEAVQQELTERKQMEEALRERTEALERSNRELERFAYVASHDLQEPLRMVASYTQLLEKRYKGKLDSDADEFIAYAVDGATRMQALINDLLTYSRVGTKGKDLKPTDCGTVLERTLDNLKQALEESGAQVTYEPLPTVMADDVQLGQLFQNLIGNAIKFRSEEPTQIHVSAERNEDKWVFSFRDNGIGIDPEFRERIFAIFQRLHKRRDYPGTGIGLAVCKKIVERHGGHIWVESVPEKGSTFYFTIPLRGGSSHE